MKHDFAERVYAAVRKIPEGKVATYAQIAELAGSPRAARAVGNALHANPDGIYTPCYRVVNAQGELAAAYVFGGPGWQKYYLEEEGVRVRNNKVDLSVYQWDGK